MITLFQLKQICPVVKTKVLEKWLEPLNAAMDEFEIDTPKRQAAFLAQVAHESGGFRYTREIASGSAYDNRKDLGNTKPEAIRIASEAGKTPGTMWPGRGGLMVTGYDNTLACSAALGIDAVTKPELLELPEAFCRSAAWFWHTRGLNALADAQNFRKITLRINGGLNGYGDRERYYKRAQEVLA